MKRLKSFDILRAMAMTLMVMAHSYGNWVAEDSRWLQAIWYYLLSPMGIPAFVFVSGLGFGFSWGSKENQGFTVEQNSKYSLSRTVMIGVFAFLYNLMGVMIHGGIENIWFWYILQTIVISRLLSIYTIRWKKSVQIIIAFIIFFTTPYYLEYLKMHMDENRVLYVIYFLSFNRVDTDSIFFFYPMFLLGQVIGKDIYYLEFQNQDMKISAYTPYLWKITGAGVLFIGLGIVTNRPVGLDFDPVWTMINELRTLPRFANVETVPMIFVKNSLSWNLYSTGIVLLFLALFFYRVDLLGKGGKFVDYYTLFGKYSLTIYLGHYIFYPSAPYIKANYIWINVLFIAFFMILWGAVYLIDKYSKGKYSIEFLVILGALYLQKKMGLPTARNSNEKQEKKA